jgi:hypothetical protein
VHLGHFFANLLAAFASFLFAPSQTHFVAGAFLDPLSAALAILGLGWTLRLARHRKFARFALLGLLILLIGAGALHDRPLPIVPHMFLVLPWFLLLAALGIEWLLENLPAIKSSLFQRVLTAFAAVLLVSLNMIQSQTLDLTRAEAYFEEERIFLRLLQRDAAQGTLNERNYLYFTTPETRLDLLFAIQRAYHLPLSPAQIIQVPVEDTPEFSANIIHLLRDERTAAILSPGLPDSLHWAMERVLISYGKDPCPVQREPLSAPVFTAFVFNERPLLCPQRGNWEVER